MSRLYRRKPSQSHRETKVTPRKRDLRRGFLPRTARRSVRAGGLGGSSAAQVGRESPQDHGDTVRSVAGIDRGPIIAGASLTGIPASRSADLRACQFNRYVRASTVEKTPLVSRDVEQRAVSHHSIVPATPAGGPRDTPATYSSLDPTAIAVNCFLLLLLTYPSFRSSSTSSRSLRQLSLNKIT